MRRLNIDKERLALPATKAEIAAWDISGGKGPGYGRISFEPDSGMASPR